MIFDRILALRVIMLLLFPQITISAESSCPEESYSFAKDGLIGAYRYKTNYDSSKVLGRFQIFKEKKRIYTQKGSHFFINPNSTCGLPQAGVSMTHKYPHELAIVDWNGGAHCCYTLYIIALVEKPFLIQKIELEHTAVPDFVDLDGDGTLEIVLNDWTFAYWKVAFAQSPAPKIVLRYNGSQWVFDPKLTISKNLDRSLNTKLDRQISDGFKQTKTNRAFGDLGETGAPVVLWTRMLDLIYSGRAKKAESLVNNIWPNDNKYKSEFLSQFTKQLTESPYYSGLKAMIPSPAPFFK
jgi:hypothetical protein